MNEAYKVVTAEYLDEHAIMIPFTRRLEKVCLGNLVAVISESVRCPSCRHSPAFIQPSCRATVPADRSQLFTRTTIQKHRLVSVLPLHYAAILFMYDAARENIAAMGRKRPSPTSGAATGPRLQIQLSGRADVVYNFRPLHLSTPPVTIYHPVFARFLHLMEDEQAFTSEELDYAYNFVDAANMIYQSEYARGAALAEVTARAVHPQMMLQKMLELKSQKLQLDGAVCAGKASNGFDIISVITEMKNEIGDGNRDPLAQAECAYVTIYCSEDVCGPPPPRVPMLTPH